MTQNPKNKAAPGESPTPGLYEGRALATRIRDWLARRFPSHIESSFTKSIREYHRIKDRSEIPDSIPSDNTHVSLKVICATEFYTPAHAEQLLQAFKKMGWHAKETSPFGQNGTDWVARSRREAVRGWINLGLIVRPGSRSHYGESTEVDLPNGFDHAYAELYSISSSLSCVVVSFFTTPESEQNYELIARQAVGTELQKLKRGHAILSPRRRKRGLIEAARDSVRSDILQWFAKNLPGVFSASGRIEFFPTCELLFLDNVRLGDSTKEPKRNCFQEYLGLQYKWWSWTSLELLGFTLSNPLSSSEDKKNQSALYIERKDLYAIDNSLYGGSTDDAYINMISQRIPSLVCILSVDSLISFYVNEVNTIRDANLLFQKRTDTLKILQALQRVTSSSLDISFLAAELPSALKQPPWDRWDFRLVTSEGKEPILLFDALSERALQKVQLLSSSDQLIRDLLIQQGNLASALEAVKTQRSMSTLTKIMTWLTLVIFLLTAGMAYIAFSQTQNKVGEASVSRAD